MINRICLKYSSNYYINYYIKCDNLNTYKISNMLLNTIIQDLTMLRNKMMYIFDITVPCNDNENRFGVVDTGRRQFAKF